MPEPIDQPGPRPVQIDTIDEKTFEQGVRFGSTYRHLTSALMGGTYKVGVAIETLPPGKQSCPFHYHMLEEEHLLMLEGECTLRLGGDRITFRAGDYMVFPAGQKTGHCLINETTEPCRYIVIGENNPDEVCVYPDSGKVSVSWLGERYDKRVTMEYFDREDADKTSDT